MIDSSLITSKMSGIPLSPTTTPCVREVCAGSPSSPAREAPADVFRSCKAACTDASTSSSGLISASGFCTANTTAESLIPQAVAKPAEQPQLGDGEPFIGLKRGRAALAEVQLEVAVPVTEVPPTKRRAPAADDCSAADRLDAGSVVSGNALCDSVQLQTVGREIDAVEGKAAADLRADRLTALKIAGMTAEQAASVDDSLAELSCDSLSTSECAAERIVGLAEDGFVIALYQVAAEKSLAKAIRLHPDSTLLVLRFCAFLDSLVTVTAACNHGGLSLYHGIFSDMLCALNRHIGKRDVVLAITSCLSDLARAIISSDLIREFFCAMLPVLRAYATDWAICTAAIGSLTAASIGCTPDHLPETADVEEALSFILAAVQGPESDKAFVANAGVFICGVSDLRSRSFSDACRADSLAAACKAVMAAAVEYHSKEEDVIVSALKAVCVSASSASIVMKIAASGVPESVSTALRPKGLSPTVTSLACRAFMLLADAGAADRVVAVDAVSLLSDILGSCDIATTVRDAFAALRLLIKALDEAGARRVARACLATIARFSGCHVTVAAGILLLGEFLKSPHAQEGSGGESDSESDGEEGDGVVASLERDCGSAIVAAINSHRSSRFVCTRGCEALVALCDLRLNTQSIITMGVAETLAACATDHPREQRIITAVCSALHNLLYLPEHGASTALLRRIVTSGAAKTLVKEVAESSIGKNVCRALLTMLWLSLLRDNCAELLEMGTAAAIAQAVSKFQFDAKNRAYVIEYACKAFWNFASAAALGSCPIAVLRRGYAVHAVVSCLISGELRRNGELTGIALRTIVLLFKLPGADDAGRLHLSRPPLAATIVSILLSPLASPESVSDGQGIAAYCCEILAAVSGDLERCGALLNAGAVDALVSAAWHWKDDAGIAASVCATLGNIARAAAFARRAGTSVLFDENSAAALAVSILQRQGTRNDVATSATTALGRFALAASTADSSDAAGVALKSASTWAGALQQVISRRRSRLTSDSIGGEDLTFSAQATVALSMLEKADPAIAPLCTSAFSQLPSTCLTQRVNASILWLAARGSDADMSVAVPLAASCSAVDWVAAAQLAAYAGRVAAVDLLLSYCRGQSRAACSAALRIAASRGHMILIERLMERWLVDPAENDSEALILAAENGHLPVVDRLLREAEVTPAGGGGAAVWLAAGNGHLAVVERLLADPRADPACSFNEAIRSASHHGHLAAVHRLLLDDRVDPGAGRQAALALASRRGHIDVVHALLADPRVKPDAFLQHVLLQESEHYPLSSRFALLREASVVRALLAKPAGAAERFPQVYGAAQLRSWQDAGWRRRRHAVLGWLGPF